MAVVKIKATFQADIETVWEVVTSYEVYNWRSDLSRIEVQESGRKFTEYTRDGYATEFTITALIPCERYEFDMENDNMKGHWTGCFSSENGKTIVEFTEDVTAKKVFMKPFVKAYLKRQQAAYIKDLEKALRK